MSAKILITGLCAFVPKKEIKDYYKNNQMRLLLVDSSRPAHSQHNHELHTPVLICEEAAVTGGDRLPDLTFKYAGSIMAVYYLDDQDVSIYPATPEKLSVDVHPIADCIEKDDDNIKKSSFLFVPYLEEISPGSGCAYSYCLAKEDVHPDVSSRMVLDQGTIRTGQLTVRRDKRVVNWLYKMMAEKRDDVVQHRQVAADIVEVEVDLTDLIFETKPFRRDRKNPRVREIFADDKPKMIRLKPGDKPIFIKNMPWPDLLGSRFEDGYDRDVDSDFSHFYKIVQGHGDVRVPHFRKLCQGSDVRHAGNPNCQPCRLCSDENA